MRKTLLNEIAISINGDKLRKYLLNYETALKNKQTAVRNIKNEYLFLNSERNIKPPIDGKYVMRELVKRAIQGMSEEEYEDLQFELKNK